MRSTPPFTTRLAGDVAAMAAAYRAGLDAAVAAWPVLLGRAIFYGVCLTVLVSFWDKVGAARLPGTLATRLPPGGLGVYIGVTEWITLSIPSVQLRLEDDIRSGALEPHLLRPKSYLAQTLAGEAGAMSARLMMLGAAGLLLLGVSGRAWPTPLGLVSVAILGVIGATLGLLLYTLVGLTGFWMRRVLPALLIVQKLMFLLGGLFAPISFYPGWLRRFAAATPFAAHLAFAGEAVLTPSWAQFGRGLAAQALWLVVLWLAASLVWRAGLARLLTRGI
jgi:ABC-2 type transport system permease protein